MPGCCVKGCCVLGCSQYIKVLCAQVWNAGVLCAQEELGVFLYSYWEKPSRVFYGLRSGLFGPPVSSPSLSLFTAATSPH